MENLNQYIPREYLALKINYLRQQLELLPKASIQDHNKNGVPIKRIVIGNHRYYLNTREGEKCYRDWLIRDETERKLKLCEAIWDCYFKGFPISGCNPHKANRTLCIDYRKQVVMDKEFFNSLSNDANTKYPKNNNCFFNGIFYRSAAERDIAIFYTEMDIPFKYEPEITIFGLPKPINPDFVIYLKELDNCKIHEHLGMKNSADYLRDSKTKYNNYLGAGLIPGIDILFTQDTDDMPFDIRLLSAELNTAIYGTAINLR